MLVKNYVLNKHPFFSFLDYFCYIMQFNHKLSIMIVKQKKTILLLLAVVKIISLMKDFMAKNSFIKPFLVRLSHHITYQASFPINQD